MPIREQTFSLAAVIPQEEVISIGNRVNAITVMNLTPAATFQLKIGNNAPITIRDLGVLRIGNTALVSDAQQGVKLINPVAQAGAVCTLLFSYTRKGDNAGNAPAITFEAT